MFLMDGYNDTHKHSDREGTMSDWDVTSMDITAVRTWFTVVGVLAIIALSLWCINIFIFKRKQIAHALQKQFCRVSPRVSNRKQESPQVTSFMGISTSGTRLLVTSIKNMPPCDLNTSA